MGLRNGYTVMITAKTDKFIYGAGPDPTEEDTPTNYRWDPSGNFVTEYRGEYAELDIIKEIN